MVENLEPVWFCCGDRKQSLASSFSIATVMPPSTSLERKHLPLSSCFLHLLCGMGKMERVDPWRAKVQGQESSGAAQVPWSLLVPGVVGGKGWLCSSETSVGRRRGWQPLLLQSADGNLAREEVSKGRRKLRRSGRFGDGDEEAVEGKGAPNTTLLSRVMCVTSHPGQRQGRSRTRSQLFPHAAHTATSLLRENVRGTHRCDGLSCVHSSYIPGEPDKDKLS